MPKKTVFFGSTNTGAHQGFFRLMKRVRLSLNFWLFARVRSKVMWRFTFATHVSPAQAGIQGGGARCAVLGTDFRRCDGIGITLNRSRRILGAGVCCFLSPARETWRGGGKRWVYSARRLKQIQANEIGNALYAQLGHHARFVYFDGAWADAHLFGNFTVMASCDDELHDFLFARGERRQ
jgi:hypothetical protein